MTKLEIEELISYLTSVECESTAEGKHLTSEDKPIAAEYNYGFADGVSWCIEMIKGRAGFYD